MFKPVAKGLFTDVNAGRHGFQNDGQIWHYTK